MRAGTARERLSSTAVVAAVAGLPLRSRLCARPPSTRTASLGSAGRPWLAMIINNAIGHRHHHVPRPVSSSYTHLAPAPRRYHVSSTRTCTSISVARPISRLDATAEELVHLCGGGGGGVVAMIRYSFGRGTLLSPSVGHDNDNIDPPRCAAAATSTVRLREDVLYVRTYCTLCVSIKMEPRTSCYCDPGIIMTATATAVKRVGHVRLEY